MRRTLQSGVTAITALATPSSYRRLLEARQGRHTFSAPSASMRRSVGFSPFGIDSFVERERELLMDENNEVGKSYEVLTQLAPIILQHEGRGEMAGFLFDKDHPRTTVELKGYQLDVSIDQIFETQAESGYGLVIALGRDEFLGPAVGSVFPSASRRPSQRAWGSLPSTKELLLTACGYPVGG